MGRAKQRNISKKKKKRKRSNRNQKRTTKKRAFNPLTLFNLPQSILSSIITVYGCASACRPSSHLSFSSFITFFHFSLPLSFITALLLETIVHISSFFIFQIDILLYIHFHLRLSIVLFPTSFYIAFCQNTTTVSIDIITRGAQCRTNVVVGHALSILYNELSFAHNQPRLSLFQTMSNMCTTRRP